MLVQPQSQNLDRLFGQVAAPFAAGGGRRRRVGVVGRARVVFRLERTDRTAAHVSSRDAVDNRRVAGLRDGRGGRRRRARRSGGGGRSGGSVRGRSERSGRRLSGPR